MGVAPPADDAATAAAGEASDRPPHARPPPRARRPGASGVSTILRAPRRPAAPDATGRSASRAPSRCAAASSARNASPRSSAIRPDGPARARSEPAGGLGRGRRRRDRARRHDRTVDEDRRRRPRVRRVGPERSLVDGRGRGVGRVGRRRVAAPRRPAPPRVARGRGRCRGHGRISARDRVPAHVPAWLRGDRGWVSRVVRSRPGGRHRDRHHGTRSSQGV